MTLFFLSVEYGENSLEWIRAGHDPAIIYDPVTDSFEELKGKGVALGIDSSFPYRGYKRKGFEEGQIVALSTDGLWEATNNKGEMFVKKRIQAIIKKNY
ncbi:MAG: serine/threonine-protein phosphatase [Desulfobacula sp.]|nr:serine/threonine-protein phosphatase [Desulfobacula sp.]